MKNNQTTAILRSKQTSEGQHVCTSTSDLDDKTSTRISNVLQSKSLNHGNRPFGLSGSHDSQFV